MKRAASAGPRGRPSKAPAWLYFGTKQTTVATARPNFVMFRSEPIDIYADSFFGEPQFSVPGRGVIGILW
jgi:hypothetical protein